MKRLHLVVGTRGSQMALAQTSQVVRTLMASHPELDITTREITTKGDVDQRPIPLDTIGKAWFTKEIEQALLDSSADFAVHSLKDMPPELPPGLVVFSVLPRDDPRDALVSSGLRLRNLPAGAVIGTDSLRRKALLMHLRPDITVKSVRGNANTRLQKLADKEYDALVMAAAGLKRINQENTISELFDPAVFVPAPGQGTLAVEVRADRPDIIALLKSLQDTDTENLTAAEAAFVAVIGGGCKLPLSCYAAAEADSVHVYGMVGSIDGTRCVIRDETGPRSEATAIARHLATELAKESFVAEYVHTA